MEKTVWLRYYWFKISEEKIWRNPKFVFDQLQSGQNFRSKIISKSFGSKCLTHNPTHKTILTTPSKKWSQFFSLSDRQTPMKAKLSENLKESVSAGLTVVDAIEMLSHLKCASVPLLLSFLWHPLHADLFSSTCLLIQNTWEEKDLCNKSILNWVSSQSM